MTAESTCYIRLRLATRSSEGLFTSADEADTRAVVTIIAQYNLKR